MGKQDAGREEEGPLEGRIPKVVLADGYRGKILLVRIVRGRNRVVVLRSGGLWHREILHDTREEMIDRGIRDARVEPLGGAHLHFAEDGSIRIWGRSDDFGACDRECAAALIRDARPGVSVVTTE